MDNINKIRQGVLMAVLMGLATGAVANVQNIIFGSANGVSGSSISIGNSPIKNDTDDAPRVIIPHLPTVNKRPSGCEVALTQIVCTESFSLGRTPNQTSIWLKAMDAPPNGNGIRTEIMVNGEPVSELPRHWQEFSAHSAVESVLVEVRYTIDAPKAGEYRVPSWQAIKVALSSADTDSERVLPIEFGHSVAVQPVKCTLDKQTQAVRLNAITTNDIRHQGDTADAGVFDVGLTCNSDEPKFAMAIQDVSTPSNTGDFLTLESTGTSATGVGLQLVRDDEQVVQYSPQPASFDNPAANQWQFTGTSSTPSQHFKVRYVNTNGQATAGDVKAKAKITVAYK